MLDSQRCALGRAPFLAVFVTLFPAAGCGLKGPLYLPTAQQLRDEADRIRELEERERLEGQAAQAPPQPREPCHARG